MGLVDKQIDLIGDAYKNYEVIYEKDKTPGIVYYTDPLKYRPYSKEEFINKIKTDDEFSKRWGVTIETIELSLLERRDIARVKVPPGKLDPPTNWSKVIADGHYHSTYDYFDIPTKLTTITYNGQTQEIYE